MNGETFTYDAEGNLTQRTGAAGTSTYTWDALGQLRTVVTPQGTTTYGYDGLGERVRKTVNGYQETQYLLDAGQVVMELAPGGTITAEYTYYPGTDRPHGMRRGGTQYYYTQDAQGNVTGLVTANGSVAETYEYTPYGELIAATGSVVNPYRYKGREWDAEAGLYFMRARYYDPALGRFVSEDPIGLAGGINPMAFVSGDPVNRSDPYGLKECDPLIEGRWGYRTTIQDGEARCVRDFEGGGSRDPILVTASRPFDFGVRPGFPALAQAYPDRPPFSPRTPGDFFKGGAKEIFEVQKDLSLTRYDWHRPHSWGDARGMQTTPHANPEFRPGYNMGPEDEAALASRARRALLRLMEALRALRTPIFMVIPQGGCYFPSDSRCQPLIG